MRKQSHQSFGTLLVLLSHVSRSNVRLNSVELLTRSPGETAAFIAGEVVGPRERQEVELYTYLRSLEKQPLVKEIELNGRQIEAYPGGMRIRFAFEVLVK
jgi:hypothetical protein